MIETGLFDHMVLQRNARNVSDATITGTTSAAGLVRASVMVRNKPIKSFASKVIGKAARGRFVARLTGLPMGGPYVITLSIPARDGNRSTISVRDVLVGDVWVCAGQSNAEGCGLLADRARPHPMTRALYMDDHWAIAEDPINCLADSIDQVHFDLSGGFRPLRNPVIGTGCGVAFGQELVRVTGVPQGIIDPPMVELP